MRMSRSTESSLTKIHNIRRGHPTKHKNYGFQRQVSVSQCHPRQNSPKSTKDPSNSHQSTNYARTNYLQPLFLATNVGKLHYLHVVFTTTTNRQLPTERRLRVPKCSVMDPAHPARPVACCTEECVALLQTVALEHAYMTLD